MPDIALVAPGTTFGWRRGDEWFVRHVREAGATCEVVPVPFGRAARLRVSMATTDVVEALAARRAARGVQAGAVVYSSVTAALLQPSRSPSAIRYDGLAAVNRPGGGGAWQRARERPVLGRADLLLPWSAGGEAQARGVGVDTEAVVVAPPVEAAEAVAGGPEVVAYAGNPHKRGLELLAEVWARVGGAGDDAGSNGGSDGELGGGSGARAGAGSGASSVTAGLRFGIAGIDADAGRRYLADAGVAEPSGIEWLGTVERERWLGLVAGARVYLSAALIEDFGLGQLEALAAGTPLAMAPAAGANEALALARGLDPDLVASERSSQALATVLERALALDGADRERYAAAAQAATAPYREEEVGRRVAELVLPRLLSTSS